MKRTCVILTIGVAAGFAGVWAVVAAEKEAAKPVAAVPDAKAKAKAPATSKAVAMDAAHRAKAEKLIAGGVKWLLTQKEAGGGWSLGGGAARPAVTAMVIKTLLQHPDYGAKHAVVKKAFDVLLSYKQKDGGIYDPKQGQQNYTTALAVMAMTVAKDPKHTAALRNAVKYLKGLQIVPGSTSPDGGKIDKNHSALGGVSYGKHGRPDLSNVGMWAQALRDAGVKPDDPIWEHTVTFVTRTQNLSETNPMAWAKGAPGGGFIYAPGIRGSPNEGQSMALKGPGGRGLRSYGTMTYVGFKSMLYAGVDRKDVRVRAAFRWIQKHWTLETNPNMPKVRSKQGLFYYYHVFAKALRAWGKPEITTPDGKKHKWRHELIDQLAKIAKADGRWQGDTRWYEDMPVLATCYGVLALQESLKS